MGGRINGRGKGRFYNIGRGDRGGRGGKGDWGDKGERRGGHGGQYGYRGNHIENNDNHNNSHRTDISDVTRNFSSEEVSILMDHNVWEDIRRQRIDKIATKIMT